MKTVEAMAQELGLTIIEGGEGLSREIDGGIYCCDLLSIVMGRAPAGGVWVTVMANLNAVAVAVLCDLSCIVIAEGMAIDEATRQKAREQNVVVLFSEKPVYDTAAAIGRVVGYEAQL